MLSDEMLDSTVEVGRLTGNAFTNTTKNGDAMIRSEIMIDRTYKDKNGQRHDASYSVPFEAYRKPAEILNKYTAKGSLVMIRGHHSHKSYTDKNGIKRFPLTVVADSVHMLEPKRVTQARRAKSNTNSNARPANNSNPSQSTQPNNNQSVNNSGANVNTNNNASSDVPSDIPF